MAVLGQMAALLVNAMRFLPPGLGNITHIEGLTHRSMLLKKRSLASDLNMVNRLSFRPSVFTSSNQNLYTLLSVDLVRVMKSEEGYSKIKVSVVKRDKRGNRTLGWQMMPHSESPQTVFNSSSVFDCRLYSALNKLSSVIHEQKNSILARLKDTAPSMRFDTFVAFLTYTVCSLSLRELKAGHVALEDLAQGNEIPAEL
jgi:hypothetical protein